MEWILLIDWQILWKKTIYNENWHAIRVREWGGAAVVQTIQFHPHFYVFYMFNIHFFKFVATMCIQISIKASIVKLNRNIDVEFRSGGKKALRCRTLTYWSNNVQNWYLRSCFVIWVTYLTKNLLYFCANLLFDTIASRMTFLRFLFFFFIKLLDLSSVIWNSFSIEMIVNRYLKCKVCEYNWK